MCVCFDLLLNVKYVDYICLTLTPQLKPTGATDLRSSINALSYRIRWSRACCSFCNWAVCRVTRSQRPSLSCQVHVSTPANHCMGPRVGRLVSEAGLLLSKKSRKIDFLLSKSDNENSLYVTYPALAPSSSYQRPCPSQLRPSFLF